MDKVRASLGLTGNIRQNVTKSEPSTAVKKPTQLRKNTDDPVARQPRGNRSIVLDDMEADIDRLIFKAMAVGDLDRDRRYVEAGEKVALRGVDQRLITFRGQWPIAQWGPIFGSIWRKVAGGRKRSPLGPA